MPVAGTSCTLTAMWIAACVKISAVSPAARTRPSRSGARAAATRPRTAIVASNASTTVRAEQARLLADEREDEVRRARGHKGERGLSGGQQAPTGDPAGGEGQLHLAEREATPQRVAVGIDEEGDALPLVVGDGQSERHRRDGEVVTATPASDRRPRPCDDDAEPDGEQTRAVPASGCRATSANGSAVSTIDASSAPSDEGREAARAARAATSAILANSDGCTVSPGDSKPALRSEFRHAESEHGTERAEGEHVPDPWQRRCAQLPVVEAGHRQERAEGERGQDRLAGAAVAAGHGREHAEGEQPRHRAGQPDVEAPAEPGDHGAPRGEDSTRRSDTAYASRISRATGAACREPMPCSR